MKTNHVPVQIRLKNRIDKLRSKIFWGDYFKKKKGSFYQVCRFCDRDLISCNMYGHYSWCCVTGIEKEIEHYTNLLNEVQS